MSAAGVAWCKEKLCRTKKIDESSKFGNPSIVKMQKVIGNETKKSRKMSQLTQLLRVSNI